MLSPVRLSVCHTGGSVKTVVVVHIANENISADTVTGSSDEMTSLTTSAQRCSAQKMAQKLAQETTPETAAAVADT